MNDVDENKRQSINIYMSHHVSELVTLDREIVKRWREGQELYIKQRELDDKEV